MTARIVDFTLSRATKTIIPQTDARIWRAQLLCATTTRPSCQWGDLEYRITIYRLPQGASVNEVPVDQLPIPRSLPFAAAPLMYQTFVSVNGRRPLLDLQNIRPQVIMVEALKNSLDNVKDVVGQWNECLEFLPLYTTVYKGKATTLPHLFPRGFEKSLVLTI